MIIQESEKYIQWPREELPHRGECNRYRGGEVVRECLNGSGVSITNNTQERGVYFNPSAELYPKRSDELRKWLMWPLRTGNLLGHQRAEIRGKEALAIYGGWMETGGKSTMASK